ncbi:MAG: hypothetical protein ACO3UU_05000 [Minisyncoccia bacterium]
MTIKDVKTYRDFLDFTKESIILCNNIASDIEYLELENGDDYDEETGEYKEIMQWYIVSNNLSEYIKLFTNDILYYHSKLDIYIWGITHFGTSWGYVPITIKEDNIII